MTDESGNSQGIGYKKPPVDTRFGGKRANRQGKGKPKTFTALRKLAQSIAAEELQSTDGDTITRIEALLRVMSTSRKPMRKLEAQVLPSRSLLWMSSR